MSAKSFTDAPIIQSLDISIILVSYNTSSMTCEALKILKSSVLDATYEVFVVDNASRDNSADEISCQFPDIKLVRNNTNVGFGRANNQVLKEISGRYILLLNTDAFVAPDTLQKTFEFMESNPDTGVLGVKLIGRDGALQPSCRYFPTAWNLFLDRTGLKRIFTRARLVDDMSWDHASVRDCDWVPGCYYMVRREVIDQVSLFDPRFFLYYEEVDHCLATKKAGWKVTYYPYTSVVHIGGESAKTDNAISAVSRQVSALQIESELLYFRKNHGIYGLLQHCFLILISELIMLVKRTIKSKCNLRIIFDFKPLSLFVRILWATRFGNFPLH